VTKKPASDPKPTRERGLALNTKPKKPKARGVATGMKKAERGLSGKTRFLPSMKEADKKSALQHAVTEGRGIQEPEAVSNDERGGGSRPAGREKRTKKKTPTSNNGSAAS